MKESKDMTFVSRGGGTLPLPVSDSLAALFATAELGQDRKLHVRGEALRAAGERLWTAAVIHAMRGPDGHPRAKRGRCGAFTLEGERELVRRYWEDRANGLVCAVEYEYDDPREARRTQPEWAKAHYISVSTLKRLLNKHADLRMS